MLPRWQGKWEPEVSDNTPARAEQCVLQGTCLYTLPGQASGLCPLCLQEGQAAS